MKNLLKLIAVSPLIMVFLWAAEIEKKAVTGKKAPAFTLENIDGQSISLNDYKGKTVVLEWINFDCPFVQKHYDGKNMQELQETYTEQGVVWFAINSSAPGKQGNFSTEVIKKRGAEHKAKYSEYLLDNDGKVGQTYGAKTTPHMYIIDKSGNLVYQGGIDSIRSASVDDIPKAEAYVANALDEVLASKKVTTPETKPYGCSVKYKN